MGFVLGFGSTEDGHEKNEGEVLKEAIKEQFPAPEFISDEMALFAENFLKERSLKAKEKAEFYKTAPEFPDRYSTFWFSVLHNANYIVAIYNFMHYNRRHPMSPDGWACLSRQYIECISLQDDLR